MITISDQMKTLTHSRKRQNDFYLFYFLVYFMNNREACSRKMNYQSAVDVTAVSTVILSSDGSETLRPIT